MSTDAEMEQYGKAAIYLRKPEKERMESQAAPFDAKTAVYVADKAELYLKAKILKKDGANVTVQILGDKAEVGGGLSRIKIHCKVIWNQDHYRVR